MNNTTVVTVREGAATRSYTWTDKAELFYSSGGMFLIKVDGEMHAWPVENVIHAATTA